MSGKESKDPMDKGEIKEILAADMAYLSREYGVERIGLFGSYVRNEQRSDSDIDLLVEFDSNRTIGLFRFVHLKNYLSDLLGAKVDLVTPAALKPVIGERILSEVIFVGLNGGADPHAKDIEKIGRSDSTFYEKR